MNEKEFKNWKQRRSKGKLKFILSEGVAFGLIMAPLNAVLLYFFDQENNYTVGKIILQSLFWIPAGFLYGLAVWSVNERQFKITKDKSGV